LAHAGDLLLHGATKLIEVDAQGINTDIGTASLGGATDALVASLARQIHEMLDAAREEAAEITRAADEQVAEVLAEAGRIESEAKKLKRKREEALAEVLDHAAKIESLFREMRGMLDDEVDPEGTDPGQSRPTALGVHESSGVLPAPNWNEILHRRVEEMLESGKSRAEAERVLKRFTIGGSYVDILDEVYAEQEKDEERRFPRRTRAWLPWSRNS
jgi:hypothetical protein